MALIECPECKRPVSTQASACPNCGSPISAALVGSNAGIAPSKIEPARRATPLWKKFVFVAAGLLGLSVLVRVVTSSSSNGDGEPAQSASNGASNPSSQEALPSDESEFISTVGSFQTRYGEAVNEFQKSAVRRSRAQAFASMLPSRLVENWVGRISSMETNSDGNGVLSVDLPGGSRIKVGTWNNALSDIEDDTLIPHGSPLYNQIANLADGDVVFFSGRFAPSGLDYVKESSVTEAGSMAEPEFIFTFVSVGRQPAAAPEEATPPSANPIPSTEGETQQPDTSNTTSEQPTPFQTPAQPSQYGNPGAVPTAPPTEQATPAGAQTDNQIQTNVVHALEANSALKDSLITVAIAQGEVTLSGTVPNESCRELAEQIVKYMPGVTKVDNNLRVGISQ